MIFEQIIPTDSQIEQLSSLLINRNYSISHKNLPTKKEHKEFVSNNPYVAWYLIYEDTNLLGSVYVNTDNSIGISLNHPKIEEVLESIKYIKENHLPLPPIKSLRRGDFFINIASDDLNMIKILKKLNKQKIQLSYLI